MLTAVPDQRIEGARVDQQVAGRELADPASQHRGACGRRQGQRRPCAAQDARRRAPSGRVGMQGCPARTMHPARQRPPGQSIGLAWSGPADPPVQRGPVAPPPARPWNQRCAPHRNHRGRPRRACRSRGCEALVASTVPGVPVPQRFPDRWRSRQPGEPLGGGWRVGAPVFSQLPQLPELGVADVASGCPLQRVEPLHQVH